MFIDRVWKKSSSLIIKFRTRYTSRGILFPTPRRGTNEKSGDNLSELGPNRRRLVRSPSLPPSFRHRDSREGGRTLVAFFLLAASVLSSPRKFTSFASLSSLAFFSLLLPLQLPLVHFPGPVCRGLSGPCIPKNWRLKTRWKNPFNGPSATMDEEVLCQLLLCTVPRAL